MDLCHGAFDGKLAAFLFEQLRAFHELALVDLPFGFRRIEQGKGRHRERADPAGLARFRFRQRQHLRFRLGTPGHEREPPALCAGGSGPDGTLDWSIFRFLPGRPFWRRHGRRVLDEHTGLPGLFGYQRTALARAPTLVQPSTESAGKP